MIHTERDKNKQMELAEEKGEDFINAYDALCLKCGKPIGYDTTFFIEKGGYVHEQCG